MVQTRKPTTKQVAHTCPLCLGVARQARTISRQDKACRLCQGEGYVRLDRTCRCGLPANYVWLKTSEFFCGRSICQPREPVTPPPVEARWPMEDYCC